MSENIFFKRADLKSCGENVIIGKTVRIRHPELVSIGDNVIIDDFTYISGEVHIGDYVHIAPGCTISASRSRITMKAFSGLSSGCRVYGGSSNYIKACLDTPTIPQEYVFGVTYEEVVLEKFCLIGANTVILPGVCLPEGVASAANMVLKKNTKYKNWSLLTSENKCLPRRGKEKLLMTVREFYS